MSSNFQTIHCVLYSILTKTVKLKEYSEVKYLDYNKEVNIAKGIVIDIINFQQKEFLILNNGIKIKLDHIIEFNGRQCTDEYCQIHCQKQSYANLSSSN